MATNPHQPGIDPAAVDAADKQLDEAWRTGTGIDQALQTAKAASRAIGRDPHIEDAKLLIARRTGCSPSEAFAKLKIMSQHGHRKIRDVAYAILDDRLRIADDD